MKFIDEARIEVIAGKGGDGSASFRRERCVPFGGPNGGDGGRGGHIYVYADPSLNTLIDFRFSRKHQAKNGEHGMGSDCYGKAGDDLILKVPVGTLLTHQETGEVIADLSTPHQKFLLAKGGNGGWGNIHFKTSTNRAPNYAAKGLEGDHLFVQMELKVLADAGLLGMPNAGKSTFLSQISNARPKVADYPFTTLHPHLGVVRVAPSKSFVVADIPGLIEGAADGAGLGHQFLRHLQRTKVLLHIIDCFNVDGSDPIEQARAILQELKLYDEALYQKPRWLIFNKIDMLEDKTIVADLFERYQQECGAAEKYYAISALTGENCQRLCLDLYQALYANKQDYSIDDADLRFKQPIIKDALMDEAIDSTLDSTLHQSNESNESNDAAQKNPQDSYQIDANDPRFN